MIEDNPGDARLLQEMFRDENFPLELEKAETLSEGLIDLSQKFYDAILLDLGLPDSLGLDTFNRVHSTISKIPIIILTGLLDDVLGIEAVKSGAQDYLVKGKLTGPLLTRAITYAIQRKKFDEEQKKQEQTRRQNVILGNIKSIFEEALSNRTEEVLGELCLSIAEDITQSKIAFIGELDEKGLKDIAISNPGWDACKMITPQGHRKPPGNFKIRGIYGKVLKEGKSFFTNDPAKCGERIGLPTGHPLLSSFLGVPLMREGKVTGLVAVANREGGYSEDELKILETLASSIVLAFSRKRDETKLQNYSKDLEGIIEERTKQLRQSERLAAIGATAGMVGHDIRNPLQAITGDLYLARAEVAEGPDYEGKKNALECIGEIEKNVDYINKIVADLQDFARPLNPKLQEADIKSIFNELLTKNGIPKNIKVSVEIAPNAEIIMADPDYIKRIAANLTLNAIQAMPNGGKLIICIYLDKSTRDVLIIVKDTGVGIPENVKPKLFTPMMTTKSKGQGFGLAVVKRMAEALGGTVEFESKEGKGTTFTVRLPAPNS